MTTEAFRPSKIPVCQQQTRRVTRQSDGDAFYQIYSGGMRAAEASDNAWHIEPVLDGGHPCAKGFMPTAMMQGFFRQQAFTFIAFHRIGWFKGNYHSSWCPFIPGQTNHLQGPADLWSNVAGNISRARTAGDLAAMAQPTREQIAARLDNRTEAERLASSISLSLRNMDISVEQIAEFYNEQLVNHMASDSLEGKRSSSTLDETLFAHVHSFFMHLGAARDYLAALCALRIGKDPQKVDSFARLAEAVRPEHFAADDLLQLLQARGYFRQKPTSSVKFESAGWMEEVTDLRNEFMHRRPYGDRFIERMGFAQPIDREAGLYRYVRPILLKNAEDDVQNVILRHYREMTALCHAAAATSGNDLSILTLTDAEIISVEFEGEQTAQSASSSDAAT
ncbi:hypothetical protein [Mesorhizobium sp. ZC-5]|uniref:hypothetical protein n=1 Tax=Mesorhizobium sp. ZC-5 TaxID=2986066 RepID=UPI0021E6F901|nr:hypothetical protein [Mesorhizobium sp. ZC-5]MCV3243466.1 hypothetical protein [Mesorhizobium sp. ZC-5]